MTSLMIGPDCYACGCIRVARESWGQDRAWACFGCRTGVEGQRHPRRPAPKCGRPVVVDAHGRFWKPCIAKEGHGGACWPHPGAVSLPVRFAPGELVTV